MIPYQKEKIENAICFFALAHKKKTRKPLPQTCLYKYLALLEFKILEKTGNPVFDLVYLAMEKGPVPIDIYNKRHNYKTDLFEFNPQKDQSILIFPTGKPDFSFFSDNEIEMMDDLIEIYADRFVNTKVMSDASHEEIKAWRDTWKSNPNGVIDFISQFPDDLLSKPEDNLSSSEEHYLTYAGLKSVKVK
jgi:uncharacterized phage-associated protein